MARRIAPRRERECSQAFTWKNLFAGYCFASDGRSLHNPAELDRSLESAKEAGVDGLYVVSSQHIVANARRIVDFAGRHRLPLVGGWGGWVQAGGLVSYGPDVEDMIRQAARYLDPVLKGANPGDLPVQQPTRFELFINLKTAKALGLDIPESLLLRADKVIE